MRSTVAGLLLLIVPTFIYGQEHHERAINFGVKAGFTSTLLLVSDLVLNDTRVTEIQNNYKIGYFGSFFMRVNMHHHFIQPEISYAINRCNVTFDKPDMAGITPGKASVESSIHSIEIPILYGYNIIKKHPYALAIFGGPKFRFIWNKESKVTFNNFDLNGIKEKLNPLNASFTLGVAVTISPVFFDFRYDIGLHNISRRITYDETIAQGEVTVPPNRLRFHRRDNVLSFSLGVVF
jgi:hypothetical protein